MFRAYRLVVLVPAIVFLLNAMFMFVAAGPCTPGDYGCP
jgi:hypothetical protein